MTIAALCSHRWLAGIGLALFAAFAALGATAAEPKRVLLLHSFGQEFAPFGDFAATFRTELAERWGQPVDLYEVPLLAARSSTPPEDAPFVDYLLGLFPKSQPDVVVAIGGPAVRFAQRQRSRLFPQSPMIFAAGQRHVQDAALTTNDIVVAVKGDLPGYVENILQVLPQTTDVAVVLGSSPFEKFWAAELRREFEPLANRINFVWFDQLTFEETKQRVAKLPPRSAILYVFMLVDAAGVPYTQEHAIRKLHAVTNVPIFGFYKEQVGLGIVGGRLISSEEQARSSADVAIRILRGESAGRALQPAPLGPGTPVYDSRELRRWGISEASLPAGSSVRFREPTVWQQYGSYIFAGVTIFVLQSALIATLFWQRARRRRAEDEAASLSGRLLTVHENERRRIARELHDDVTQRLAALAIEAALIDSGTRAQTEGAFRRSLRDGLMKLSEDVHALSYRLHPSVIDDLGLVEALKAEGNRVARAGSVTVNVKAGEVPRKLPKDTALCLFRIAQEALRNVVRHAGASAVEVSIAPMDDGLQLAVSDNGSGFDATRDSARRSLGHASMRERVHLLGGEVDIESTPGHGTTVIAWVPLQVVAS